MKRLLKLSLIINLLFVGLVFTSELASAKTWTIEITSNGFNPSSMIIDGGDTITFKNFDTKSHDIESNPHPIHNQNLEMNLGIISPGQEKSVTLNGQGSYGYHDHLDSTKTGQIIVDTENPNAPSIPSNKSSSILWYIIVGIIFIFIIIYIYYTNRKGGLK